MPPASQPFNIPHVVEMVFAPHSVGDSYTGAFPKLNLNITIGMTSAFRNQASPLAVCEAALHYIPTYQPAIPRHKIPYAEPLNIK
jgi:hypothetical protein